MPSVTGVTTIDGELTLVEVSASSSIQVWSVSLYARASSLAELLCGERTVLTFDVPTLPQSSQLASRTGEPLCQGVGGEDLVLRGVGNEIFYNVQYSLI